MVDHGSTQMSFVQPINPKVDFSLQWFTPHCLLQWALAGTTYLAAEQLISLTEVKSIMARFMSILQGVFLYIGKHLSAWKKIHSSVEGTISYKPFVPYTAKGLIPTPQILWPKSQGWPLILGSNLQYSSSPSPISPLELGEEALGIRPSLLLGPWTGELTESGTLLTLCSAGATSGGHCILATPLSTGLTYLI